MPNHEAQLSLGLLKVQPQELGVSPEAIQGRPFRYFTFTKTPEGYGFKDLTLPQGWQKAISKMQDWLGNVEEELIVLDPQTKALLAVGDRNTDAEIHLTSDGSYKASGITDIRTAIRLQAEVTHYLNPIAYDMGALFPWGYPMVSEYKGGPFGHLYGSAGLTLPGEIWERKKPFIRLRDATQFTKDAKTMARELGGQIEGVSFWENGTLASVTADRMSCACYGIIPDNEFNGYIPHNVDTAQQAVVLHNAVSMYLNLLLEKGVEPKPLGIE